jgi:hypothetical protein
MLCDTDVLSSGMGHGHRRDLPEESFLRDSLLSESHILGGLRNQVSSAPKDPFEVIKKSHTIGSWRIHGFSPIARFSFAIALKRI